MTCRTSFTSVACAALALVLLTVPAHAQTGVPCRVTIDSPATGATVGPQVLVTGKATLSPGTSLAVFARKFGLVVGWPQGGGVVVPNSQGDYAVLVTLGTPTETGKFELVIQAVDSTQRREIETWFRRTEVTGQYPGMPLPSFVAGCGVPLIVTIDRTA